MWKKLEYSPPPLGSMGDRLEFRKVLKIAFVLANSADFDEMSPLAAFLLGLHCLTENPFRDHLYTKG